MKGPFTYEKDGLITRTNCDFCADPRFLASYHLGASTLSIFDSKKAQDFLYGEWRVYICCWVAEHAKKLDGDFVECGVNSGFLSRAVMNYIDFKAMDDRRFYLFDTFRGIPVGQLSESEVRLGFKEKNNQLYGHDIYEQVKNTFSEFDNAVLIQGVVPDSLTQAQIKKVCYLSIDMNCAFPELQALEFFWDRLVVGAIVILDDYGFSANQTGYINQKLAIDAFAIRKGVSVLCLPTGQGLIVKS
jgi:O-methyltransferase